MEQLLLLVMLLLMMLSTHQPCGCDSLLFFCMFHFFIEENKQTLWKLYTAHQALNTFTMVWFYCDDCGDSIKKVGGQCAAIASCETRWIPQQHQPHSLPHSPSYKTIFIAAQLQVSLA